MTLLPGFSCVLTGVSMFLLFRQRNNLKAARWRGAAFILYGVLIIVLNFLLWRETCSIIWARGHYGKRHGQTEEHEEKERHERKRLDTTSSTS